MVPRNQFAVVAPNGNAFVTVLSTHRTLLTTGRALAAAPRTAFAISLAVATKPGHQIDYTAARRRQVVA